MECNLDTVAARNILKVALASQVAIQGAVECSSDPFMEMHEMDDQCVDPMHQVPTATGEGLQHIIDCADGNEQCDVTDMIEMMEGKKKVVVVMGKGSGFSCASTPPYSLRLIDLPTLLRCAFL